jgi:hypothetical protein
MNWIKFILWLCSIYAFYYTAIIAWDLIRNGGSPVKNESNELTFVEHTEPAKPEIEQVKTYPPSAMVGSGGVNLKQMFSLCREEAIEFTRGVSF